MDSEENNPELITITKKEYDSLVKDSNWLSCLENAGVDNWGGCDYARELYREAHPDEDD